MTKNKKDCYKVHRKKIVVQALATSIDLLKVERNRVGLDPTHIEIIKSFYRREDIACFMPGKQDVITLWYQNGKRTEQKRIFKMTIGEACTVHLLNNISILPLANTNLQNFGQRKFFYPQKSPAIFVDVSTTETSFFCFRSCIVFYLTFFHGRQLIESCVCNCDSKS